MSHADGLSGCWGTLNVHGGFCRGGQFCSAVAAWLEIPIQAFDGVAIVHEAFKMAVDDGRGHSISRSIEIKVRQFAAIRLNYIFVFSVTSLSPSDIDAGLTARAGRPF